MFRCPQLLVSILPRVFGSAFPETARSIVFIMTSLATVIVSRVAALVTTTGERAVVRFLDFFTSHNRNSYTRKAYARGLDELFCFGGRRGV